MKQDKNKSHSNKYNPHKIEEKWSKVWKEKNLYSPDINNSKNPFYNLMMFPYPSAEGLHVGNMYAFTGADVFGRFKRMSGFDVLEPMGLDGFGIHSENYAIKVGRHPIEHAKISQDNFYRQLESIGNSFAWDHKLETYDPKYYKWTQWLFIKMWEAGLAYKAKAKVNWCPTCKTVLADEQVIDGKCERTGDLVERREMSSWYFKITDYADTLLQGIDNIKWPEKIKTAQRQWIGKSTGLSISFDIKDQDTSIDVWTKYWETIFGATFIVVSPEYINESNILIPESNKDEVNQYVRASLNKSEQERKLNADKTGVFTGVYAINPATGSEIPVWVADYVLSGVGTSAVMGVPSHDARDFEFAKKFDLELKPVLSSFDADVNNKVLEKTGYYEGDGVLINSGEFNDLEVSDAKDKISDWLIKKNKAKWLTTYHLRDWLISRQRYWGPPIPMVNCDKCGFKPVPMDQLPVELPELDDFKPKGDGTSPLANAPVEWQNTTCPSCGGVAKRELDVSDTFLDSSWYFLRYPSIGSKTSENVAFDPEITEKWLPVDTYIGGAEHAVLHLLYSRFVWKVLLDSKLLPQSLGTEPFPFLYGHGLIIKDGAKMSKSKGNIVVPDEYIKKFGADTLRLYLMFLGPYDQGGDFRDTGIEGMHRFVMRVNQIFEENIKKGYTSSPTLLKLVHKTIKKVTSDFEQFKFNTAISSMMELTNVMRQEKVGIPELKILAQLLAPFAPFYTEEAWEALGEVDSIHVSLWPQFDNELIKESNVFIIVQVDGKMRGKVEIEVNLANDKDQVISVTRESISKWLNSSEVEIIFVPGRIINYVNK